MAAKAAKGSRGGAAEGPYPPLVLVVGSDPFLVDEAAGEALDELSPGWREDEFKVTRVAGAVDRVDDALAALRQVREAILQPGFFAAETVVWLRGVSFSGNDRTSKSEDVRGALALASAARACVHDLERIHTGDKANVLEVAEPVIKLLRRVRVPFEHCHAGLQLGNVRQFALFRAVFPVDRVAAMVDTGSLIPVCLHEQAGTVNSPGIVGTRGDIGPAKTLLHGGN